MPGASSILLHFHQSSRLMKPLSDTYSHIQPTHSFFVSTYSKISPSFRFCSPSFISIKALDFSQVFPTLPSSSSLSLPALTPCVQNVFQMVPIFHCSSLIANTLPLVLLFSTSFAFYLNLLLFSFFPLCLFQKPVTLIQRIPRTFDESREKNRRLNDFH